MHEDLSSYWRIGNVGCLESLVYYKALMLRNHKGDVDIQTLVSECRMFLDQLKMLDPMRSQRYEQIGWYPRSYHGPPVWLTENQASDLSRELQSLTS